MNLQQRKLILTLMDQVVFLLLIQLLDGSSSSADTTIKLNGIDETYALSIKDGNNNEKAYVDAAGNSQFTQVLTDTIKEKTSTAGITIDETIIKDSTITENAERGNNLTLRSTTNATKGSTTTGSMVIYGGVGITKNVNIGGNINSAGNILPSSTGKRLGSVNGLYSDTATNTWNVLVGTVHCNDLRGGYSAGNNINIQANSINTTSGSLVIVTSTASTYVEDIFYKWCTNNRWRCWYWRRS